MRIAVPRERAPRESRVALVPESVGKLVKAGATVVVEHDAGLAAGFPDAQYTTAGATIAPDLPRAAFAGADLVARCSRPTAADAAALPNGCAVVSYWQPGGTPDVLAVARWRARSACSRSSACRASRARSRWTCSRRRRRSRATRPCSSAPRRSPRCSRCSRPRPARSRRRKAFVIGAGVAGLQAIATARRLGAVVSAFDVRAAAQEQIQSLGATVLKIDLGGDAEGAGGYAKAQSEDQARLTQEAIAKHIAGVDLVITTAAIPGRRAPILITADARCAG